MYKSPQPGSNFDEVGDFHHKFGLRSVNHDGVEEQPIDRKLLEFRIRFMLEELKEFVEGAGGLSADLEEEPITWIGEPKHEQMFDALLDLVYVAMGTAHLLGYPWQGGWDLVQRANMQKIRAAADGSDSKRGSALDVVKPPGWWPPNIALLLQDYDFDIKENE